MFVEIARKLGFEVKCLHNSSKLRESEPRATSGVILEFLGARGVGKSTLFNATLAKCRDRWFFRHHLAGIGPVAIAGTPISDAHRRILFSRLDALHRSSLDAWQSAVFTMQHAQVVIESLQLCFEVFPRGFAFDEGLFKNLTKEVLELDYDESASLWQNRVFVYVQARDPATVVKRYRNRKLHRAKTVFQHPETDGEIALRVQAESDLYDRLISKASELRRPFLIVSAEDQFETNVQRVLDFEKTLVSTESSRDDECDLTENQR